MDLPLGDNAITFGDVVVVVLGGGEAGVVGEDAKTGADRELIEEIRVSDGDGTVFLRH